MRTMPRNWRKIARATCQEAGVHPSKAIIWQVGNLLRSGLYKSSIVATKTVIALPLMNRQIGRTMSVFQLTMIAFGASFEQVAEAMRRFEGPDA
jgi:hypothetical protein